MRLNSLLTTAAASAALIFSFSTASQAAQSVADAMIDFGLFQIEDDSAEILINSSEGGGNTIANSLAGGGGISADTTLDVGDVLFGFATFPQIVELGGPGSAALDGIDHNTLSAIFAVEVASITDADANGTAELITFTYSTEFNSIYSSNGAAGTSVIVLYEDAADDFNVAGGGTPWGECTSLADCSARASGGTAQNIVELGFTGDPDESWSAANAPLDLSILQNVPTNQSTGSFNFFLGTTASAIGAFEEVLFAPPFDGSALVEWAGSGNILGVGDGVGGQVTTVFDATDDAQISAFKIPEPATLGIMGLGLLGLGFLYGRRRTSSASV